LLLLVIADFAMLRLPNHWHSPRFVTPPLQRSPPLVNPRWFGAKLDAAQIFPVKAGGYILHQIFKLCKRGYKNHGGAF